jgi:predicted transcriptional regulator
MERTQIYLDPEHKNKLRHMAIDKKTSMSDLIRRAIDLYLSRQPNEQFLKLIELAAKQNSEEESNHE